MAHDDTLPPPRSLSDARARVQAERNIAAAVQGFGHLAGNPFRVLICMALRARGDEAGAPRYRDGPAPLLQALGRTDPPPDDVSDEAERVRHANDVTLRRAIGDLLKADVITYAVRARKGEPAQFRLHLDGPPAPASQRQA